MKLFIVATPIGNMGDITVRALQTLNEVDLILAEDTRQTKKILDTYKINTPVERFDAKIEAKKSEKYMDILKDGKSLALVTDAGTPGISDPGGLFVEKVREEAPEIHIVPIPGPSALTTTLSIAGINRSDFVFLGFLPHKKGRQTLFKEIARSERPVVFFESPHRLMKTLESLNQVLEDKKVQVFRELTKVHESVVEGSSNEVLEYFKTHGGEVRGEVVLTVVPN